MCAKVKNKTSAMKRLKLKLNRLSDNVSGKCISLVLHFFEKRKFKSPKRVAIYEKVKLTKEQKREIDSLYLANYGKKVPYIWHRHYTAFTGNFDKNYMPELLYIPEFEAFMNLNKAYNKAFSDKNVAPFFAESAGVKMPKTIVSCVRGIYRDSNNHIIGRKDAALAIANIGEAFIKPSVDSNSGRNCAIINLRKGVDVVSGNSVSEILESIGDDFVLQEKIVCHKSISDIYSDAVNTFRIITYIWRDKIVSLPAFMRIGSGGNFLDNAHAGGMFIAVENNGTLHKTAFTEFKEEYTAHPDTNLIFEGYKIEIFPKVVEAAKRMHEMIPQIGAVNWDFTIDEEGEPVLIEMNIKGGAIWPSQMSFGEGIFGENTAEILQWLALMKKTKPADRYKYAYGNFTAE